MVSVEDLEHELSKVKDKLSRLGSGIADAFSSLGDAISNIFSSIKMIAGAVAYGVINFASNLKDALVSFAQALWSGIKKVAQIIWDALNWVYEKITGFFEWIVEKIHGIIDGIMNTIMSAYNWIKGKISSMSTGFANFVNSAIQRIALASREKIVLMTSVNFAIIGMYKGLDLISEGKIGKGLLSMFISPIAGAIGGKILDALLPRPVSLDTPFIHRGEVPDEGEEEAVYMEASFIINPTTPITIKDECSVIVQSPVYISIEEPQGVRIYDYCSFSIFQPIPVEVSTPVYVDDNASIMITGGGGYYYGSSPYV